MISYRRRKDRRDASQPAGPSKMGQRFIVMVDSRFLRVLRLSIFVFEKPILGKRKNESIKSYRESKEPGDSALGWVGGVAISQEGVREGWHYLAN